MHYAWIIMIGVCFMQMGGLGACLDAAGVFFVPVCEDLGILRGQLAMYLTFYFIATIVAMPIVGSWIQKFNINKLLTIAMILTAAAIGCMGFYTAPWQWWISGLILGTAGSFIFVVPGPILIQNWFYKRRGIVMGISMAFSGIGGAVLSPIFTALILSLGWRHAYIVAAIIIAVLVVPWTAFVFKLHPSDKGLIPYGWSEEEYNDEMRRRQDLMDAGETATEPGVEYKTALKSLTFWMMFLFAGFVAYFAGFNSHLPGYAESIGYTPMLASTVLTAVMVGNLVEKLIVGYLNDKLGVRITVNIQIVLVILGLLMFIFVAGKALILLYLSAFFFGAQNSLYSVSNPLIVRQLFGGLDYPKVFTSTRIGTGVIGCLGPMLTGFIYDFTGTFKYAFVVAIVVAVLVFIVVHIAYGARRSLKWSGMTPEFEAEFEAAGHLNMR